MYAIKLILCANEDDMIREGQEAYVIVDDYGLADFSFIYREGDKICADCATFNTEEEAHEFMRTEEFPAYIKIREYKLFEVKPQYKLVLQSYSVV